MSAIYDKLLNNDLKNNEKLNNEYIKNIYELVEGQENKDSNPIEIDNTTNDDYCIISIINNIFGVYNPEKTKQQYFDKLQRLGVKIIKYDSKSLMLEYNNKKINIDGLYMNSEIFDKSDYTSNPYHYTKDIYIPILIRKIREINNPAKIVIGNIKEESLLSNKLFAWIEVSNNDKTLVLDFVNNIIIDKDIFYMFYKPNILNQITKESLIDDKYISMLINDFNVRYDEYLIFNKEYNKEIENKKGTILK